jgi:single-strand DNA-binding protein
MITIQASGNVTKDGETSYTKGGTQVYTNSLASNRGSKDNQKTTFIDFTAFGKAAEFMEKLIAKGSKVTLFGELEQDNWEYEGKKYSKLKMVVSTFDVHSRRAEKKEVNGNVQQELPESNPQYATGDIPF